MFVFRSTNFERKSFLAEPKIPPNYFKAPENPKYQNLDLYVPAEIQISVSCNGLGFHVRFPFIKWSLLLLFADKTGN